MWQAWKGKYVIVITVILLGKHEVMKLWYGWDDNIEIDVMKYFGYCGLDL
jgi:hypothetical protein